MKTRRPTPRKTLIQMAQVFRKQLNMDDETFALLKQNAVGKSSLSEMCVPEINLVLDALRAKGAKFKGTNRQFPTSGRHKQECVNKIKAIWVTMDKQGYLKDGSIHGLNGWIKRITQTLNKGKGVEKIEWLSQPELANKVLECLKQWHKREMSIALRKVGLTGARIAGQHVPLTSLKYDDVSRLYDARLEQEGGACT